MSYEKNTWNKGDVITSAKLNHMENGIADGGVLVVNAIYDEQTDATTLDKTWQQIHDAPFAVVLYEDEGTLIIGAIVSVSNGPYSVIVQILLTSDGNTLPPKETFLANSANGYPVSQYM